MIKRISSFVLLIAMVVFVSACSVYVDYGTGKPDKGSTPTQQPQQPQLYKDYDNLVRIGQFHNGLAPFLIHESSSTSHWGTGGSWSGDYFFGYIDIQGNVVIEPRFECTPYDDLPVFETEYVRIVDLDNNEFLIDRQGAVHFQSGKDNVERIGNVSEGYFWVETVSENLSGKTYTVSYYQADTMQKIATYEDVRAFYEQRYTPGESTVSSNGEAILILGDDHSYYNDELIRFQIAQYDDTYTPSYQEWPFDMSAVDSFEAARNFIYHICDDSSSTGWFATVVLRNSSGTFYYAVIDSTGHVLLEPQKDITFPITKKTDEIHNYEFCMNLCPAKDASNGSWGYIDPYGNWKISPQYASAVSFSADGYATVNDKIVIDSTGKVVLSPDGWVNEIVTSLSGKYRWNSDNGYSNWYLTFTEDGELEVKESMSGGSMSDTGTYTINGSTLIISDIGYQMGNPLGNANMDGEYTFVKEGNSIIINGIEWILVE